MFPVLSFSNVANSGATHAVFFRECGVSCPAVSAPSDLSYLGFGELGRTNLLAFYNGFRMRFRPMFITACFATSFMHVAHIVCLCTLSKMRRINTRAIVARVQDLERLVNAAMSKKIRKAVGAPHLSFSRSKCAMTFSLTTVPYPAIAIRSMSGGLIYKRPKAFFNCLRLGSAQGNMVGIWTNHGIGFPRSPRVLRVFRASALLQMFFAHTGAVAAFVQNLKGVVERAVIDQIGDTVSQICRLISNTELPMTVMRHSIAEPLITVSVRPLAGRAVNKFLKAGNVLRSQLRNVTIGLSHEFFSLIEKFVVRADERFNTRAARFAL